MPWTQSKAARPKLSGVIAVLLLMLFIPLCTLVCEAQSTEDPQPESSRITASLSLFKSTFAVGEPVSVRVEISNQGQAPILIANDILMATPTQPSHISFVLKDQSGRETTGGSDAVDAWGRTDEPNAGIAFLKRLMLLKPDYYLATILKIDKHLFLQLSRPGKFSLYALYTSNGLKYPPVQAVLGVTGADVNALPFAAWSGKVRTNTVTFRIVPKSTGARQDEPRKPTAP